MTTPAPAVYALHGLRVSSALPLAARVLGDDELGAGGVDVDIRLGPSAPVPDVRPPEGRVVAALADDGRHRFVAVAEGPVTTLRVPGLCDFVIGPGRGRVECRPDPSADPEMVALLVTGLLVAYLLTVDGHCVLHASAVEVDGAAIAFLGCSGMGKSTMAALCCAAGARLVTDDVLRLDTDTEVRCVPGSTHVRLRDHAGWALDQFDSPPATVPTIDGRTSVTTAAAADDRVPLRTIVLLCPSTEARAVAVRPLEGARAFLRVMAHPRVIGWQDEPVRRRLFGHVARVVNGVAVVEADVPWGPAYRTSTALALFDLVAHRR